MASAFALIEGEPQGGQLKVFVQPAHGDVVEVEVPTYAGDSLRQVTDRVVDTLALAGMSRPDQVDRVQRLIVVDGAEDLDIQSLDEGILSTTWLSDEAVIVDNGTAVGASGAGPEPAGEEVNPDRLILNHLGRYVTSVANQAETSTRVSETVAKVQSLYISSVRALMTDDDTVELPNPGLAPLTANARDVAAVADRLGAHAPAMLAADAALTDARADQIKAIEAKEREAKRGAGRGDGGGTGTKKGGSTQVPSGSPPIAEGQPPTGGGTAASDDKGEELVRPAGSSSEYARHIGGEELLFVKGRGLSMVIGRIGDRWYLAKNRVEKEFLTDDGRTVMRSEWHLGDFREDAAPEDRPVEIDHDKLMAFLNQPEPTEETSTAAMLVSVALDFLPIIGDVKGLIEAAIGRDLITNVKLSTEVRALGAVLLLIPFAGRLIRGITKAGLRTAGRIAKAGGEISEQAVRHTDDAVEAFTKARKADGAKVVRQRIDIADDLRLPSGSALRTGCFATGTLVAIDEQRSVPIETLKPGDTVLTALGSDVHPCLDQLGAAKIVATRRRSMPGGVRLWVLPEADDAALPGEAGPDQEPYDEDDLGRAEQICCTPRHPLATPRGYVAADDLRPDDRLLLAQGTARVVEKTRIDGPLEVVNIEVAEHHCFFVGRVRVLVHNWCEKLAQRHLNRELDQLAHTFRDPTTGNIVREPAFRNGQYLGYGHHSTYLERAQALGIPVPNNKITPEIRVQVNRASKNSTKPDYVGDLHTAWGDLPVGTRVNIELKTVPEGHDLGKHLARLTDGGKKNKGSLLSQAGMRVTQTPGEHVLLLDISHAEGFRRGGNVTQQVSDARVQLQYVINNSELPFGNLHQAYPRVAFMVRDASGAFRISAPIPMPRLGG